MSDETLEPAEDGDAAPAPEPKGRKKKKLLILAGGGALLLAGAGGGAYALFGGHGDKAATHPAGETADPASFVDVPPMMVNLRSNDGTARFLKVHFVLVPGPRIKPDELKNDLPMLLDSYQPFLRELRPEDLDGSAAVYRIKEQLLVLANQTLGPDRVQDVLIQDLIQQ
ncbi:MAG: flagellar basal body-associated FliL family protein [Sphingomonas sp.]